MARRKVYDWTIQQDRDGDPVCPCCFKKMHNYDRHHVFPHFKGGHGFRWNMLAVCKSCHALATFGSGVDQLTYSAVFTYYMIGKYGLLFALQIEHIRETVRKEIEAVASEVGFWPAVHVANRALKNGAYFKYKEMRRLAKSERQERVDYWVEKGHPVKELI